MAGKHGSSHVIDWNRRLSDHIYYSKHKKQSVSRRRPCTLRVGSQWCISSSKAVPLKPPTGDQVLMAWTPEGYFSLSSPQCIYVCLWVSAPGSAGPRVRKRVMGSLHQSYRQLWEDAQCRSCWKPNLGRCLSHWSFDIWFFFKKQGLTLVPGWPGTSPSWLQIHQIPALTSWVL